MSLSVPPPVALVSDERIVACHAVEYSDRVGVAWLTSMRVILRADQPTAKLIAKIAAPTTTLQQKADWQKPEQFTLPLDKICGFKSSAAASPFVMLMLNYVTNSQTVQPVVLRFVGAAAVDERARWREVLGELQLAPMPTAAAPEIRVKAEPGTEAAAAATAAAAAPRPAAPAPAAAAAPSSAGAAAQAAKPSSTAAAVPPRAPGAGQKRPHGQMGAAPSAAPPTSAGATVAPHGSGALSPADLQSLLQSRAALLARDPALKQLHSELVPGAVSADEFWASRERAELLRGEQLRQNLPLVGPGGPAQRAGISSAMAGAVKADTAGGVNTVRYTLDAASIHAIFLENPVVLELFQELVPTQLTEKDFWTRYFRSQYIHSQASGSVSSDLSKHPQVDDLFSKAKAIQEARENEQLGIQANASLNNASSEVAAALRADQEAKRDVQTKVTILQRGVDPSVDLTAADLPESVLHADPTRSSGAAAPASNTTRSRKARAQTELLQRYNRHGMLVLDNNLHGAGAAAAAARNNAVSAIPAPGAATTSALGSAEQKLQSSYHAGLASSLEFVDLSREVAPVYNQLPIASSRGFFFAAGGGVNGHGSTTAADNAQVATAAQDRFREEMKGWSCATAPVGGPAPPHSVQHVPDSASSLQLVLQLTATARGMNKAAIAAKQLREEGSQQLVVFSTGDDADVVIPDQFRDELKKRYHTCTELFRHFWSSLNPRTSAKLRRVAAALDEQYRLLHLIRSSLNARSFSALVPVLNPLIASIEKCHSTFTAWEEKEAKRMAAIAGNRRVAPSPPNAVAPLAHNQFATPLQPHDAERDAKRVKV